MIKVCDNCGGLYATENFEMYAGRGCECPPEKRETTAKPEGVVPIGSKAVLDITDTDRMNWLEAQQPNTLIVEPGMVTNSLRIAIDEKIKQERAAVMSNEKLTYRRENQ